MANHSSRGFNNKKVDNSTREMYGDYMKKHRVPRCGIVKKDTLMSCFCCSDSMSMEYCDGVASSFFHSSDMCLIEMSPSDLSLKKSQAHGPNLTLRKRHFSRSASSNALISFNEDVQLVYKDVKRDYCFTLDPLIETNVPGCIRSDNLHVLNGVIQNYAENGGCTTKLQSETCCMHNGINRLNCMGEMVAAGNEIELVSIIRKPIHSNDKKRKISIENYMLDAIAGKYSDWESGVVDFSSGYIDGDTVYSRRFNNSSGNMSSSNTQSIDDWPENNSIAYGPSTHSENIDIACSSISESYIPLVPLHTGILDRSSDDIVLTSRAVVGPRRDATKFSQEELKSFRYTLYRKLIDKNDECCCICYGGFRPSQACITLECNHYFHKKCVLMWLKSSVICPYCRIRLK